MDYDNFIANSIESIESNLFEKLSVDELAEQSFFSKYHYQRLFRSIAGDSVMEYVKKRRLTLAAEELSRTSVPILDIALKYGYSSHETFTRAFRSFHGVTPTDCRKYAIFQSFSKLELKKERLIMASNKMLTKTTDKLIALLNDFVHQSNKLGGTTAQIAKSTNLGIFDKITDQTLLLSSQTQKEVTRIADLCKDNSGGFVPINNLFQIIKEIENVAFRSNILALNANLQISRTAKPSEMILSIGDQYRELAHIAGIISNQSVTLFGELSDLIQTDLKTQAGLLMHNVVDTMEQTSKRFAAITTFLGDESEKSGGSARSVAIIADELGHIKGAICDISKSLQFEEAVSKANIVKWVNVAKLSLNTMEDLGFRIDILAYAGQFETVRIPNEKGINDATNQLTKLAEEFYAIHQECADFVSKLENLLPIIAENIVISPEPPLEKVLTDVQFQGCILYFYLKMEFAKFGYRKDIVSDELSKTFELILQDFGHSLSVIETSKFTPTEPSSKSALQAAFADIAKSTAQLVDAGKQMGEIGGAVGCLAFECNNYAKRLSAIKF